MMLITPEQRQSQPYAAQLITPPGQDRIADAEDAVAAHLQQHAGQDHADRRRRLDVGVRQPGVEREDRHLDRKPDEQDDERRQWNVAQNR
jgi:hypothetical protein